MSNLEKFSPKTLGELMEFANMVTKTDLVPPAYKGRAENALVAMQLGSEVGLKPLQSLQNIAVINGRPSMYGDSLMALCRKNPDCESIEEDFDTATMTATCKVKRKGSPVHVKTFSIDDAKEAKLWGKAGPWTLYPKRMLQMRARGFALRDVFADSLQGIITIEEARDIPLKNVDVEVVETKIAEMPAATQEECNLALDWAHAKGLSFDEDIMAKIDAGNITKIALKDAMALLKRNADKEASNGNPKI